MTPLLILDASVSSPCERPTIAASLNRDLVLVSIDKWCAGWGMLTNSAKTYGMMISRSRTACLMFPDLFVGGSIVKMVGELKISGVVLDSKLTFESHVRSVAASASRRIGILWKPRSVFRDNSIVSCFWSFILHVLEYCSPVWMSAAVSHLPLLDRGVRSVFRFSGDGVVRCDLWHRRRVTALSLFYRIRGSAGHSAGQLFLQLFTAGRPTRQNLAMHPFTLVSPRCCTSQYLRTFIPACVSLWNMLDESDFAGDGLEAFKTAGNCILRVRFN